MSNYSNHLQSPCSPPVRRFRLVQRTFAARDLAEILLRAPRRESPSSGGTLGPSRHEIKIKVLSAQIQITSGKLVPGYRRGAEAPPGHGHNFGGRGPLAGTPNPKLGDVFCSPLRVSESMCKSFHFKHHPLPQRSILGAACRPWASSATVRRRTGRRCRRSRLSRIWHPNSL